jgi:ribonuclease Z
MKITSIGVGEAFDDNLPNNSHLVETQQANILLDCGYSVPQSWFRMGKAADFLDAIWISHQHADHFAGLPMVLMRMWEGGRTKPITIFCEKERVDYFSGLLEMFYPGFSAKFGYAMNFVGVEARQVLDFNGLELSFAPMIHSVSVLAIKVTDDTKSMCYSGDGQFTSEAVELYKGCDLVIQETYLYDEKKIGHACITDAIEMAEHNGVKRLALTHLQRDFRRDKLPGLRDRIKSDTVEVLIPEPLDEVVL